MLPRTYTAEHKKGIKQLVTTTEKTLKAARDRVNEITAARSAVISKLNELHKSLLSLPVADVPKLAAKRLQLETELSMLDDMATPERERLTHAEAAYKQARLNASRAGVV